MNSKKLPMVSAVVLAALIPAAAMANLAVGETLGTDVEAIRAELEAQGLTVMDIEVDGAEIEVEYMLNGEEFEAILAGDSGAVLEVTSEAADDDDDNGRDDDDEDDDDLEDEDEDEEDEDDDDEDEDDDDDDDDEDDD